MIKVLIAYYSLSGTTKKVATRIARGLRSSSCKVTLTEITPGQSLDTKGYDLIGIGSPTYYYRLPFVVSDFVKDLQGIDKKPFFIFITHGTIPGSCGNRLRGKLIAKNARDLGYFRCFGADFWSGYIKRGVLFSPHSPDNHELKAAEEFGKTIAKRFQMPNSVTEPFDSPTPLINRFERFLVSRPVAKLFFSKTFYADKFCDACGVCIEKCPVKNIKADTNGKPQWQSSCILCTACELCCPKDSVHSATEWRIFSPLVKYNIWKAKKMKIPYAAVKHIKGTTISDKEV